MATPHVAGAVMLLIQNEKINGKSITASSVVQTLKSTGKTISGIPRIDLLAAVNTLNSNSAPNITISNSNGTYTSNVTLNGSAIDDLDGDISSNIVWTSNLDGSLGTGSSISVSLTSGNHTITATIEDTGKYSSTTHALFNVKSNSWVKLFFSSL